MVCRFEVEEVGVVRGDGEFLCYGVLASVEQTQICLKGVTKDRSKFDGGRHAFAWPELAPEASRAREQ
jgi:hypothetical protein